MENYSNYFFYNNECYALIAHHAMINLYQYQDENLVLLENPEDIKKILKFYKKHITFYEPGFETVNRAIIDNPSIHFKTLTSELVYIIFRDLDPKRRKDFIQSLKTHEFQDLEEVKDRNQVSQNIYRQLLGVSADCKHQYYGFSDSHSSFSLLNEGMAGLLLQRKYSNPLLNEGELIYSKILEQLIILTSKNVVFDAFYNGRGVEPIKKALSTYCKDKELIDQLFLNIRRLYLHRAMTTPQTTLTKIQVSLLELAYFKAITLKKDLQRNFMLNFKKFMVTNEDVKKSVIGPRYVDLDVTEDIFKVYTLVLMPKK